jgi:hypothetical protein
MKSNKINSQVVIDAVRAVLAGSEPLEVWVVVCKQGTDEELYRVSAARNVECMDTVKIEHIVGDLQVNVVLSQGKCQDNFR